MQTDTPDPIIRRAGIRWEVFPNTDADAGGWYSYVESSMKYLGGNLHPTRALAEADAKRIAKLARMEARSE